MKKRSKRARSAFSLIELSIVLVVIGIVIAGIMNSSAIISQARLSMARSITANSEIAGMNNLMFWLESTNKNSFASTVIGNTTSNFEILTNGKTIARWKNNAPANINNASDLTQTQPNLSPTFFSNSINGLPVARFSGNLANQYLVGKNFILNGGAASFVIVAKRRNFVSNASAVIGKFSTVNNDSDNNSSIVPFFEDSSNLISTWRIVQLASATHPGNGVPYITTTVMDGLSNNFYLNGTPSTSVNSATPSSALNGSFFIDQLVVGCRIISGSPSNCFDGDIAEILIFRSALQKDELNKIHKYLGKKFKITVNSL